MTNYNYIQIRDIINEASLDKLQNVNLYGLLTFISEPKLTKQNCYCITVILVDSSCENDQKLKCLIFSARKENSVFDLCKKGDIIRFHRLKIQEYNGQPQGLGLYYSSWIAFTNESNFLSIRSNNEKIYTINDNDYKIIKNLQKWLLEKSNFKELNDSQCIKEPIANNTTKEYKNFKNLITFSLIPEKGYFNMMCQICAICCKNKTKFLIVWDGTKSTNKCFHKEEDFVITSENFIYISDLSYYYHVYIFDEHQLYLQNLTVGDYIVFVNLKTDKPRNLNEIVIKLSGNGQAYGRKIIKLDPLNNEYDLEIKSILINIFNKAIDNDVFLISTIKINDKFKNRAFNTNEDEIDYLLQDNNLTNFESNKEVYCNKINYQNVEKGALKIFNFRINNPRYIFNRTVNTFLQRLVKHTFFTKITPEDNYNDIHPFEKMSFKEILNLSKVKSYFKCKCTAKIFNYYTINNPLYTFVNVFCKNCYYQNTLPFHFVNVYEPTVASKLFLIDKYDEFFNNSPITQETKLYFHKQNFSVDWLMETKPSNIIQVCYKGSYITSFTYDCPRCFWFHKKINKLNFFYRFSFVIIDENKIKLGPCFLENDIALKYFDYIDPIEFCCVPEQSNKISDKIFNMMNKSGLFELECYNQNDNNFYNEKEKIVYKIKKIDFNYKI